jgi:Meiotically Up-regulated Gene 113 (MUG113) protein
MSCVYIVEGAGVFKIGATKAYAEQRLLSLQSASPVPLRLIHQIPTASPFRLERYLHAHFKGKRTLREWFALSEEDLDWLRTSRIRIPLEKSPTLNGQFEFDGRRYTGATDAAALAGITRQAFSLHVLRGTIRPAMRIGGRGYFDMEDVQTWLKDRQKNGVAKRGPQPASIRFTKGAKKNGNRKGTK